MFRFDTGTFHPDYYHEYSNSLKLFVLKWNCEKFQGGSVNDSLGTFACHSIFTEITNKNKFQEYLLIFIVKLKQLNCNKFIQNAVVFSYDAIGHVDYDLFQARNQLFF